MVVVKVWQVFLCLSALLVPLASAATMSGPPVGGDDESGGDASSDEGPGGEADADAAGDGAPEQTGSQEGGLHGRLPVNWFGIKRAWLLHPPQNAEEAAGRLQDTSWLWHPDDDAGPADDAAAHEVNHGRAAAPASFTFDSPAAVTPAAAQRESRSPVVQSFVPPQDDGAAELGPLGLQEAPVPDPGHATLASAAPYVVAVPLAWLAWRLGRFLVAPLFTRFHGEDALRSPRRACIAAAVEDAPGITITDLADQVGVSLTTTVHHVRILERTGHVESRRHGRSRHIFPAGRGVQEKRAAMVLHHDKARHILAFIERHPGAMQRQVAGAVGIGQSLAHWHLRRLEEAGLVSARRDGRSRVYRCTAASQEAC